MKVNTREDRSMIFEKIKEARSQALRAGVDSSLVNDTGDSSVTVWVLAHLLRLMAQGGEDEDEEQETIAREETQFSHAEISEFSDVFNNLAEEGGEHDLDNASQSPLLRKLIGERD